MKLKVRRKIYDENKNHSLRVIEFARIRNGKVLHKRKLTGENCANLKKTRRNDLHQYYFYSVVLKSVNLSINIIDLTFPTYRAM